MIKYIIFSLLLIACKLAVDTNVDFRLYFCFIIFAKHKDQIMSHLIPIVNSTIGISEPNSETITKASRKYSMAIFKDCRRIMGQYNDEEVHERVRSAVAEDSKLNYKDYINLDRNFQQIIAEDLDASDELLFKQIGQIQRLKQVG